MTGTITPGTTLVCLPPTTADNKVIFGKNCDRAGPREVQEVVHVPATGLPGEGTTEETQQCTFGQVKKSAGSHAVVLNKATWMWGAHMGTNEHSLTIGYNRVRTRNDDTTDCKGEESLLAADLVRLALERCKTAEEALDLIISFLSSHTLRHNDNNVESSAPASTCFILVDNKELWVLETAGSFWATKKMTDGVLAFCGELTIGREMDKASEGLKDKAKEMGFWNPDDGPFDFAKAFNKSDGASSQTKAQGLLNKLKEKGPIRPVDLFALLRDLSLFDTEGASTMSSMVSALSPSSPSDSAPSSGPAPSIHWFTATPLPDWSMFKPMIFCDGLSIGSATLAPIADGDDNPEQVEQAKPFSNGGDAATGAVNQSNINQREHLLWEEHAKLVRMIDSCDGSTNEKKALGIRSHMRQLEELCCQDVEEMVARWQEGGNHGNQHKAAAIFEHIVDLELNFLK